MDNRLAQMHVLWDDGKVMGAHHVGCRCQQPLAQLAAGMVLCKVLWLEMPPLHQCHCYRVTHGKHGSGATGWGEVQGASLLLHAHLDMHRAVFRQQRLGIAAHADDRHLHVKDNGDEAQQLIRLPRIAQCQHHVVACHHAEVAVIDIQGVDEEGGRSRR